MDKKVYHKPSVTVVALHQSEQLLEQSSGFIEAERRGYGRAKTDDWD